MNNTIAWIMTIFIIVTIIVDLNALMLMRTNKKDIRTKRKQHS